MLPYVTELVYISQIQNSYKSCIPTHKDHFLLHPPTFLILVAATYSHSSHVPPGPGQYNSSSPIGQGQAGTIYSQLQRGETQAHTLRVLHGLGPGTYNVCYMQPQAELMFIGCTHGLSKLCT